jgi:hypothetical protein
MQIIKQTSEDPRLLEFQLLVRERATDIHTSRIKSFVNFILNSFKGKKTFVDFENFIVDNIKNHYNIDIFTDLNFDFIPLEIKKVLKFYFDNGSLNKKKILDEIHLYLVEK